MSERERVVALMGEDKVVDMLVAPGEAPFLLQILAGSYPGYIFTDPPLSLPSGHFGLGYGGGAHAPDEFLLIESAQLLPHLLMTYEHRVFLVLQRRDLLAEFVAQQLHSAGGEGLNAIGDLPIQCAK